MAAPDCFRTFALRAGPSAECPMRGSGRRGALLRSCPPASPPPLLRCAVHRTGLSRSRAWLIRVRDCQLRARSGSSLCSTADVRQPPRMSCQHSVPSRISTTSSSHARVVRRSAVGRQKQARSATVAASSDSNHCREAFVQRLSPRQPAIRSRTASQRRSLSANYRSSPDESTRQRNCGVWNTASKVR